MTTIRRFTPTPDYRCYVVTAVDEDGRLRTIRIPHALGETNAWQLAREQLWREEAMDCTRLTVMAEVTWDDLKAQGLSEGELREWSGK